MAATIGTWSGFTNGSDPASFSSTVIDSGSNRKFVHVVMGETDTGVLSISTTLGGQSPSETKSLDVELGTGNADVVIRAFIYDNDTILAMNANNVTWSDGLVWSKISWGYVTVQDTDQGTTDSANGSTTGDTTTTITWPSTTDSNGIVVAIGVADSANRAPINFDTGVTSRMTYSVADYAAAVGDGSGGGAIASSMTVDNDGVANSGIGSMGLWFPEISGGNIQAMMNYYNRIRNPF